jgi:Lrp/AsnC family transcriptional regulator, leucine-responsive regulatory protein
MRIDEYDKKILRLLQVNNRLTGEELSERVNLSQSAVQRRIEKLRRQKIIQADISVISESALGNALTCIVEVNLHDGSAKKLDHFKNLIRASDEVVQCYFVTGVYDFILIVNTRNMEHFENFVRLNLMNDQNVKHFQTQVVMSKIKMQYGANLNLNDLLY